MTRSQKFLLFLAFCAVFSFMEGYSRLPRAFAQSYTENVDGWQLSVAPGADILSSSLDTRSRGGTAATKFEVMIALAPTASDSVVYFHVTQRNSGLTKDLYVNSNNALVAGQVYNFEFNAGDSFLYNFRVATTTVVQVITVNRKVN